MDFCGNELEVSIVKMLRRNGFAVLDYLTQRQITRFSQGPGLALALKRWQRFSQICEINLKLKAM
jgi:hypothetical protein